VRILINSTLAPPLEALGSITKGLSDSALQTSVAIANQNLAGLSGLLQGVVTLINQAQLQVRNILGVFVTREHVRHNKSGITHRGKTRISH
jgi:hypothetical protein